MAKKKGLSVNDILRKSGKIIAVCGVIVAILFTLGFMLKQTSMPQEASTPAPVVYSMYPIAYTTCTAGYNWITVKQWGRTYCAPKCYDYGGKCYDTSKGYAPSGSIPKYGVCPGSSKVICYVPYANDRCSVDYASTGGRCQANYKYCKGSYVSGKCPGFSWYQCCTRTY